jgi:hypothetical protein
MEKKLLLADFEVQHPDKINIGRIWNFQEAKIMEKESSDYFIYPFPVMSQLCIFRPGEKTACFKLLDLDGKVLNEGSIVNQINKIDVLHLAVGIYKIIIFENGKMVFSGKTAKI